MIGFFTPKFGMHYGWELFLLMAVYAPNIGVVQAYSRSLLSTMLPKGHESQFFSFYEITDKGSSWLGPAIVAGLARQGMIRYSFIFIWIMLIVPAIILHYTVDEELGVMQAEAYAIKYPPGRLDSRSHKSHKSPSPLVRSDSLEQRLLLNGQHSDDDDDDMDYQGAIRKRSLAETRV